ncbi:hypothetical protein BCEN4_450072 [Burkholderia cenocepacia]|nr:hypothetical protein BCEN4_450072 [Burkholderia cenocepacia]
MFFMMRNGAGDSRAKASVMPLIRCRAVQNPRNVRQINICVAALDNISQSNFDAC